MARRCPECGAATVRAHRPFCSARCRLRDLARWLDGEYRVQADHPDGMTDFPVTGPDNDPQAG